MDGRRVSLGKQRRRAEDCCNLRAGGMSKWGACTFLCALTGAAPPELGGFLSLSALKHWLESELRLYELPLFYRLQ
eukprot:scaffold59554_cov18-Tisochrysis_lutea.AAC.1